jgi:hypothetical protein
MVLGVALTAGGVVLPSAGQADAVVPPASTATTFSIVTGALSISAPAAANLGGAPSGSTHLSALLGDVQVIDARAGDAGSWIATVSSTSFVTGGGGAADIIPSSDVTYDPGEAVQITGTGTFTAGPPGTLGSAITAFSATSEVGSTSVEWNPQITIAIPPAAVAGVYTGTITHSVA